MSRGRDIRVAVWIECDHPGCAAQVGADSEEKMQSTESVTWIGDVDGLGGLAKRARARGWHVPRSRDDDHLCPKHALEPADAQQDPRG